MFTIIRNMNKKEIVFRRLGCGYIDEGRRSFTQLDLSRELGMSLSIVNAAITSLRDVNAVRVKQRSLEIMALDRLLLYWATHRNLRKDIVYQTRVHAPVLEIEKSMPDGIAFTGYTAYRFLFKEAPADYSEVYLYSGDDALSEIKSRFQPDERTPNLFVLECDSDLEGSIKGRKLRSSSVCVAQLFVDLWNMNEWYAKDYVEALSKRLGV